VEGGAKNILAVHLSLLAEAYAQGGALTEALTTTLDEAFAALGDEEIWRPDLLRLRGDLLIAESGLRNGESGADPQLEEVERCYREAIERAHGMGTTAFELRATTRLGRLLQSQGHGTEARALLAPLCAAFTEGFDTRDLRGAKALRDELGWFDSPGMSTRPRAHMCARQRAGNLC
jgi:adenylate cyclase